MASQSPRQPTSVTVSCRCGAYHIIDVLKFGQLRTCKKCGSGFSVVWKRDPKSNKQAPLVVASAKPRRAAPQVAPESMIDLACGCGYRRKAAPDEIRKSPRCPGCGKPMYVDRAPRPKKAPEKPSVPFVEKTRYGSSSTVPKVKVEPAPQPRPKLTPRPPSGDLPRVHGETRVTQAGKILVICSFCGDRLLVNADRQGGLVKCMRCDTTMTVQAAPGVASPPPPPLPAPLESAVFDVPAEPEAPEPPPPSAPKRVPAFLDGPTLECLCGAQLDVRGASPGSAHDCESCGRQVTMQKARHPQTLSTVMKPIFSDLPEIALPEPEAPAEPGALDILCACGEALTISPRDVGHPLQCPGCSVLMEIEQTPGGLKVKPIGRIDEQDWSLTDFS